MDTRSDAIGAQALRREETRLIGNSDEPLERIHQLIDHHLERLAIADGGWSALYRDPGDGRLWELTYPESYKHGGGPPALFQVSETEAQQKYGAAVPAHR